jgi:alkyl hydroperoxide reductase subunit F
MIYDLIIVGGGPAAVGAGVYAARKQLNTLVIAKTFEGQSTVSPEVYNWIGTPSISGQDLSKSLKEHLLEYEGEYLTIERDALVQNIIGSDGAFTVKTDKETTFETKTVLIASGATRRKLTVPGAKEFDQKGLTYCASCDGPLFSGMDVVVIGGGNAGFESAAQLLAYAKSVTLLDINESFNADPITVEKVLKNEHMKAVTNAETLEILGEKMVTGIRYKDTKTGEETTLSVQGVFVEIGSIPNTNMVESLVDLDNFKRIKVDARTQQSSTKGIWAAGDCTDGLYAQNNIAVGDAVKALEDIYVHLKA